MSRNEEEQAAHDTADKINTRAEDIHAKRIAARTWFTNAENHAAATEALVAFRAANPSHKDTPLAGARGLINSAPFFDFIAERLAASEQASK